MEYEFMQKVHCSHTAKKDIVTHEHTLRPRPIRLKALSDTHQKVIQRISLKKGDRDGIIKQLIAWGVTAETATQLLTKLQGNADGWFRLWGEVYYHASRGKEGVAGGATVFFQVTEDGDIDLVGVGHHDGLGVTNRLSRYKLSHRDGDFYGNIDINILDLAKKTEEAPKVETKREASSGKKRVLVDEAEEYEASQKAKQARHEAYLASEEEQRRLAKAEQSRRWFEQFQEDQRLYEDPGTFGNYIFYPRHPRSRGDGHCFWDSLVYIGFHTHHIQTAAAAAGLTYGDYVTIDKESLSAFFTHLQALDGRSLRIGIVQFDYGDEENGHPVFQQTILGLQDRLDVVLAIFTDPDSQGHFVPAGDWM